MQTQHFETRVEHRKKRKCEVALQRQNVREAHNCGLRPVAIKLPGCGDTQPHETDRRGVLHPTSNHIERKFCSPAKITR
jgi:hypothetical protein